MPEYLISVISEGIITYINMHLFIYMFDCLRKHFSLKTDPAKGSRLTALLVLFIQLTCTAETTAA